MKNGSRAVTTANGLPLNYFLEQVTKECFFFERFYWKEIDLWEFFKNQKKHFFDQKWPKMNDFF